MEERIKRNLRKSFVKTATGLVDSQFWGYAFTKMSQLKREFALLKLLDYDCEDVDISCDLEVYQ